MSLWTPTHLQVISYGILFILFMENDSWEQTFDNSLLSMMRYIHKIRGDSMIIIFKFRLQNINTCSKISQFKTCGCVFIDANTKYLRQFLHHNILETCPIEIKLKAKDNKR